MMNNGTVEFVFLEDSWLPLHLIASNDSTWPMSHEDTRGSEGQSSPAPAGVSRGVGTRWTGVIQIVMPVFYLVTFVFGLIGNSLTIFVILANLKKLKSLAICFILNLAVADDLFLASLPFIAYNTLSQNWIFGDAICKFMTASRSINSYVSILTMVVMSIDRYLAIVHPLRSMRFRTPKNGAIACLLLWIACVVILTPYWLYANARQNKLPSPLNLTTFRCTMTWPTATYETVWVNFETVSSFLLPILVMVVCYSRLVRCLLLNPVQLQDQAKKPIRKVTVMVSIVTTTFVVCWAPYHIILYRNHMQRKYFGTRPAAAASMPTDAELFRLVVFNSVSQALIFISSCCNPFIYCISSKNFSTYNIH